MFKIIKIEYFDEFKCLMSKCKDNCCDEDWRIIIDEDTYNRYLQMEIPNLDKKISDTSPRYIIKNNGKCPFITSEGLCCIHRDHGEDHISETCRSYPRFASTYGDVVVENLGLSCPAVVEMLLSLDRKIKITVQTYYEIESEVGQQLPISNAEGIMWRIINYFYDFDNPIEAYELAYSMCGTEKDLSTLLKFPDSLYLIISNISISFLFENIMLESVKESPNLLSVLDKCLNILTMFYTKINSFIQSDTLTSSVIVDSLYPIMRKMDH